jgi:hypothetical protein
MAPIYLRRSKVAALVSFPIRRLALALFALTE